MDKRLARLLDANFNRAREGLRVCEDVLRFVKNSKTGAMELKQIRHRISAILKRSSYSALLAARDSDGDVGRGLEPLEDARRDWRDLYAANLQRSKEAVRVLEEVSKLQRSAAAGAFKKIRFQIYAHEKKFAGRF